MTKPLTKELATLARERARLEKEHMGKFVLIHGDDVIGNFDNFQKASEEGLRQFSGKPFLIRQIGAAEENLSPAVVLGLTSVNIKKPIHSPTGSVHS